MATSDRPPNVLWILTDEQRADSLGCEGSPWAVSPHLDRLAARGVRFTTAYTPSPVCVSARAAMLTGQAGSRLGVMNNHQALRPEAARFLTHAFRDAGYDLASFGKSHYNCRQVKAFDLEAGCVLDKHVGYMEYRVPVDDAAFGTVYYPSEFRHWILAGRFPGAQDETAEAINAAAAISWLREARDPARPFFLRLSLNAPHTPVVAPAPYDTLVDPERIDLPLDTRDSLALPRPVREHLCAVAGAQVLSPEQIRRSRQVYYGRTAFVDAVIGAFLRDAEALGALDHTIIVFTSDHGCHLGDHGFFQKQSFYEASCRVPLILAGSGVAEGIIRTPVSTGSLLPTLLELTGIPVPAPIDFPSLAPAVRDAREPEPRPVISEIDFGIWGYRDGERYAMVRQGDWKLALFRDPRIPGAPGYDLDDAMLHNLAADPGERRNLVATETCAPVRDRLIQVLADWDAARESATGAAGVV